ncbi:MAG: S41 family peptidase [Myxococcota bacterium]
MRPLYRTALALGMLAGCRPAASERVKAPPSAVVDTTPTTNAEELRAFAKLYGYVRFFHPTDAAAQADWDRLAIEGARRVTEASDRAELSEALNELFKPVAPTIALYPEGTPVPSGGAPGQGPLVAWQHRGFGFGRMHSIYDSVRTERTHEIPDGFAGGWAPVVNAVDAAPLRGKRVRLRARVRVQSKSRIDAAGLWLRIDRPDNERGAFDNMNDRPIRTSDWTFYEIELPVAEDAVKVAFGGILKGSGPASFDDFSLVVVQGETTTPVEIDNPSFEAAEEPTGWSARKPGYVFDVRQEGDGKILRISRAMRTQTEALFDARPARGEVLDRALGAGLRVRLPVALPDSSAARPSVGAAPKASDPLPGAEDPAVRIAAVIVGWNVLQHFYPYFDVIDEDWDEVLDATLEDVLDDEGPGDLRDTLERMVARLHDGHGRVAGPLPPSGRIPASLIRIGEQIVVARAKPESGLQRGDRVLSIDGTPIEQRVAEVATRTSGSPQWIEHRVLGRARVSEGPAQSEARVEIERGGATQTVEIVREVGFPAKPFEHPPLERRPDGVFYVDLDRASWPEIQARLDEIATAPGVVFDLRGYPNSNDQILAHLITEADHAKWMFVPLYIYPDQQRQVGWQEEGWGIVPAQPHIEGKVAFITGGGAVSYAESVMGLVEGYQLGEIVGSATAGANGNVNPFEVPGGFTITYTGMKVTRLDGRTHHGIGVEPTVPAQPTREGITAGRDELLEVALKIVRGGQESGDEAKGGKKTGRNRGLPGAPSIHHR